MLVSLGTTQWARDLNRHFTKEKIQMDTKHKKGHPNVTNYQENATESQHQTPFHVRQSGWKDWHHYQLTRIWNTNSQTLLVKMQNGTDTLKKQRGSILQSQTYVYHVINKSTPGYLPQNKLTQYIHTKTSMWMFSTLVTIAPNWKRQCPVFEYMNKSEYFHTCKMLPEIQHVKRYLKFNLKFQSLC